MDVKQIITVEKTQDLKITGATLLSIEEVKQLPLELRKYYDWWWLKSRGINSYYAAFVNSNGSIDDFGYRVHFDSDAVRPALKIKNLKSSGLHVGNVFVFGGKEFKVVSNKLAFCLTDIGSHCFRKDWKAKDANDYNKSDIKKYLDDWFEMACRE